MMDESILRRELLKTLPISRGPLVVRSCQRSDLDLLAAWPAYPDPYSVFTFSFAHLGPREMDSLHDNRQRQEDRITLVADHGPANSIAYLALLEIEWGRRESRNLGIRVHPEWCGKGVGGDMLAAVRDWWFANGMGALRLDVASSNERAVGCYEKAGFVRSGEFWREASDLIGANLADSKWRFLDGHVRHVSRAPEVRFLLMELKPG